MPTAASVPGLGLASFSKTGQSCRKIFAATIVTHSTRASLPGGLHRFSCRQAADGTTRLVWYNYCKTLSVTAFTKRPSPEGHQDLAPAAAADSKGTPSKLNEMPEYGPVS